MPGKLDAYITVPDYGRIVCLSTLWIWLCTHPPLQNLYDTNESPQMMSPRLDDHSTFSLWEVPASDCPCN